MPSAPGPREPVEKLTRRGKSVAWEIDVDTALYRIPNPDVADVVNTIQKMAQKRALVAATLIATSASEFFTQDVEDADSCGRNVDTGSHPPGTREAQEYVRDRKLEELRSKPAVPVEPDAGGEAMEELRRDAPGVRASAGAGGRDPVSGGTGTGRRPEPGSVPVGQQGVGMLLASGAHRRATGGGVMAVLAVVPSPAVTAAPLYVIEDQLAALIETAELVSPEQEQEFRAEFQAALTAAVDKRDRVGQFLAHLEQQIDFAKFEIDRLRQRKATCERALARLENYVIETIENLGTDSKGKYRTLEGKTTTFSLRACPPSVEVTDESAIPAEYKMLLLKLPAVTWEQLLDGLEIEQRAAVLGQVKSPEVTVDKRSIKAAIDGGADVPGAGLATGRHSLRRS